MRKYFTFILAAVFLSAGMIGCGKDDSDPKTEEEKDEAVKATLVGKWQRVDFEVAEYKGGKFVKITDEGILQELQNEMPRFTEVTMSKFIMLMSPNSDNDERMEMTYTLDAKTNTIVLTEGPRDDGWDSDIIHANYVLSGDKNNVSLIIVFEEDTNGDGVVDIKFQQTIKFKRIANWPAG